MATRWYCTSSVEHCLNGGSNGQPGSGPKSRRCPQCKSVTRTRDGVYAILRHRPDGRYRVEDALAVKATERSAQTALYRIDPSGANTCIRFL